ncbi:MAG: hypothetical protein EAS48_08240 [Chryseobacterium sp.]|nr:MAG: hypothetical protein EAS48_08240 [Chryseobacterium sp.]
MQSITVYPENPADFELSKSMLEKMQIPLENCDEQDFEFTEAMKKAVKETQNQDRTTFKNAGSVLAEMQ